METTGIIEVIVELRLNADVNESEANKIMEELDYQFTHKMIADATIIDYDTLA